MTGSFGFEKEHYDISSTLSNICYSTPVKSGARYLNSLDGNPHGVGHLAIYHQRHVHFTASDQAAR